METLLSKLQFINDRVQLPTSSQPLQRFQEPPKSATHVYTKQHDTRGLDSRYRGPFRILSRPTRTTAQIKVGEYKDRSDRTEVRHWGDMKPAKIREGEEVVEASRPRRGRPPKRTFRQEPEEEVVTNNQKSSTLEKQTRIAWFRIQKL